MTEKGAKSRTFMYDHETVLKAPDEELERFIIGSRSALVLATMIVSGLDALEHVSVNEAMIHIENDNQIRHCCSCFCC